MSTLTPLLYLMIVVSTALLAVAVTAWLVKGAAPAQARLARRSGGHDILRNYRFREGYLLSDIDGDDAFLDPDVNRATAFERLVAALAPFTPDLGTSAQALLVRGEGFLLDGKIGDDAISVGGRLEEGTDLILTVFPSDGSPGRQVVDSNTLDALRGEMQDLRYALDVCGAAMWREDTEGAVIWANPAYLDLVERQRDGQMPGWPLPRLFAPHLEPAPSDGTLRRCLLEMPGVQDVHWFEVSREVLSDGSALYSAIPCDRLVKAETGLREFMQTLTKTFASLPIGLVVFDKRRELVTFNPSLVALTDMEPQFLISRPDLRSFLDMLRNNQRMPEPRDYRSWREEVARLEQGAESGTYQEMWELPGLSYRVTGRPHPDGAIAFMFEDLSAEVSLTRKFHSDLDLFQSVLDASPDAIAVFDMSGILVRSNAAYERMWDWNPEADADPQTLARATATWSSRCKPSRVWGEIRQSIDGDAERGPWTEQVETLSGDPLTVRMAPAKGRHTVLYFSQLDASRTDPLADMAHEIERERERALAPQNGATAHSA